MNPPLVRLIATLPVVALSPNSDWHRASTDALARSEWTVGKDFIEANQDRARLLFTVGRCACIPISLFGAWICAAWAARFSTGAPGAVYFAAWHSEVLLSQLHLAHSGMIGPDAAAAAAGAAAGYVFWRWLRRPSWSTAFLAGLVLGVAELTKFTWIALFLLWPALWLVWKLGGVRDDRAKRAIRKAKAERREESGSVSCFNWFLFSFSRFS